MRNKDPELRALRTIMRGFKAMPDNAARLRSLRYVTDFATNWTKETKPEKPNGQSRD